MFPGTDPTGEDLPEFVLSTGPVKPLDNGTALMGVLPKPTVGFPALSEPGPIGGGGVALPG